MVRRTGYTKFNSLLISAIILFFFFVITLPPYLSAVDNWESIDAPNTKKVALRVITSGTFPLYYHPNTTETTISIDEYVVESHWEQIDYSQWLSASFLHWWKESSKVEMSPNSMSNLQIKISVFYLKNGTMTDAIISSYNLTSGVWNIDTGYVIFGPSSVNHYVVVTTFKWIKNVQSPSDFVILTKTNEVFYVPK